MRMNLNRQNQSLAIFAAPTAAPGAALFQANLGLSRPVSGLRPMFT